MVGHDVPPLIQKFEIDEPSMIRRVGSRHVQRKAESIEILLDVLDIRVTVVERALRCNCSEQELQE